MKITIEGTAESEADIYRALKEKFSDCGVSEAWLHKIAAAFWNPKEAQRAYEAGEDSEGIYPQKVAIEFELLKSTLKARGFK